MSTSALTELLVEHGAGLRSHSGRSLLVHLEGTASLIESWGLPQSVINAGFCHSIYGTDGFDHSIIPLSERKLVRKAIGAEAESLVYLFSSINRTTMFGEGGAADVTNREDGSPAAITAQQHRHLIHLELANWIDQFSVYNIFDRAMLQQAREHWQRAEPFLCTQAKAAWARKLRRSWLPMPLVRLLIRFC